MMYQAHFNCDMKADVKWCKKNTKQLNCQLIHLSQDHFGFEAAAWYWHFVDVVRLFLSLVIIILHTLFNFLYMFDTDFVEEQIVSQKCRLIRQIW